MNLSKEELELVKWVYNALSSIKEEATPIITDYKLARLSSELRELLVIGKLGQCWRSLGFDKQPSVVAIRLRTDDLDDQAFGLAAGGRINSPYTFGGIRIMPNSKPLTDTEAKDRHEKEKDDSAYCFPLNEYLDSCGLFLKGKRILRQQVIKYVANKKGGVHLDSTRKKEEEAYKLLDEAIEGRSFSFSAMHPVSQEVIDQKNAVYAELLSIAQNVTESPDVKKLIEKSEDVLKRIKIGC
jgi:hypothetical protein